MNTKTGEGSGKFVQGHPSMFHAHKPGHNAGRPKALKAQVKDALTIAEDAMPQIIAVMIERANSPHDKDSQRAAEFLVDRIYGKATLPVVGEMKVYNVVEDVPLASNN